MNSIISVIAKPIYEYAIEPLIKHKHNIEVLEERKDKLVDAKERVERKVAEARQKEENIEREVEKWLTKADQVTKEAEKFLLENAVERNCFADLCFNPFQRHQSSKKAKEIGDEILKLYEEENFDEVSYRTELHSMDWSSTLPSYVTFESRKSIMKEILEALEDPHMKMIGVYGMGGVGKTTLVDEISRRSETKRLFDEVVKVTISQTPDVDDIQRQLGDRWDLRLDQQSKQGRAVVLRNMLLKKKILYFLDDMWNGLNLEELGIPSMDDCKGSKIIVTSREKHVLSNEMNTDKNFLIEVLSAEDSWKVFKNIVGEDVETNHELKKIAIEIVKKCGRLPIALVVVAKALKGKPIYSWRDALSQLKKRRISMEIKGVSKDLYSSLVLSYEFLESEEAKSLFLLCSLFPEDYDIEIDNYLFTYVMGLGFLRGTNTLGDARDRILKLVYDLKSCCLLLKSDRGDKYVKMHDAIRDVAIDIASKNEKICTLSYGKELNEWKDEDMRNYMAIWVDYHSMLPNLPQKLRFQKLELLALRGGKTEYRGKLHILEVLFEGIRNLKVLWVEQMYLFPWPSSFLHLTRLKTLSLINCELGNIEIIGDLKELESLNLSHSDIKELPKGIDQLLQLKLLDVSYCAKLQLIPPNVISRLIKLEVLHTKRGFNRWEKEDLSQCDGKNASLSELNYLPLLTNLSLDVPNPDILSEGTFSVNLRLNSFEIAIGKTLKYGHESSRVLDIKMESISILLDGGLNKLLKKCEKLILEVRQNGNDVLSELDRSDSPHLKQLHLTNNSDIAYLFVGGIRPKSCHKMMFSILEKLELYSMMGLESIIDGPIKTIQVFNNLKTIRVGECNKLRNLFPLSLTECLSNLEEILVLDCEMMETIFEVESEDVNNRVECRQLRKLWLWGLPRLMSICSKLREESENDTEIEEDHQLFNPQVAFPNLEELEIMEISNLRMIWHPKQVFGSNDFCKLHELRLEFCRDMRIVFTYNVMKNLNQLQYLSIDDCDSVEEVFEIQRSDAIEKEHSFPLKLERIVLSNLPNLKKVWSNDPCGIFNFQCLKYIDFRLCPNLQSIFPTSLIKDLQQLQRINIAKCGIQEIFCKGETPQKVLFPHLESIQIRKVDNLEMIWHKQLIVDDLSKLETILLHDCKNLKSFFQSNEIILTKLKVLDIENCDSLEEVFGVEEEESEIVLVKLNHVHFENLQEVKVNGCPKLKRLVPFYLTSQFHRQLQSLEVDYYGLDVIFPNLKTSPSPSTFLPTQDAFSNLIELKLKSKKDIGESWLSKFSRKLFLTLKVLHFDGLNDNERTHSLSALNPLLYHLEELKVCNAFLLEIFSDDGLTIVEKKQRRKSYALLKRLILENLPKLMHIWNESLHLSFENLECIKVDKCSSLKILVQSSSFSLRNLTKLEISECHGLINLLNSSVAKTLVQLQEMTLQNCKCMTTVLTGEEINEEEKDDEIVFNKLEKLKLDKLPGLEKFQGEEKCTLKFPSLKRFVIVNCHEMKTFSPGVVCTPLLKTVIIRDSLQNESDIWADNMNDTLRKLWEDENMFKEESASVSECKCGVRVQGVKLQLSTKGVCS